MVSQDVIAQLRQDITTATDAGDQATADRLRAELSSAIDAVDNDDPALSNESGESGGTPDLAGTGAAPQPPDAVRETGDDAQ
ncbi:hypothetical protein ACFYO1_17005 [Nocardia sp. NPDC006044]|uniref:hypothetical protein n=1 Tax=Nocardia sp. NPDC006044 TaxID=3364306 RepID=UPI0036B6E012